VAAQDIPGSAGSYLSRGSGEESLHVYVRRVRSLLDIVVSRPANFPHSFYADLDVECLRPHDELFAMYNVTTITHDAPLTHAPAHTTKAGRKAFFGRMGTDSGSSHSIPNAWMASTPGHPFFLLQVEAVMKVTSEAKMDELNVESVGGPQKLYDMINEYNAEDSKWAGDALDKHVMKYPTSKQFTPRKGLKHSIEVLPFQYVFPYSWERDGEAYREICWATKENFDVDRCKKLLATDHWPSYAITYWSHTWTAEGHDEGNVELIDAEKSKD
jgi:inositol phosphorylceramide mannosyltransferase catalytic subunit